MQPDSVADVCAGWLKRHVEAKGLRTGDELERVLERYVLPHWRDRPFTDIRRSDVAALLDAVEDKHGPWVADSVLSVLRCVATWYATRHDDYVPPFVKNMRRVPAQARKRSRILSDAELRRCGERPKQADVFGAFVQLLLLTAQRREKVATMKWSDLDGDVWTIPTRAAREGQPRRAQAAAAGHEGLGRLPRMASNPYVFHRPQRRSAGGFSDRHARLQGALRRRRLDVARPADAPRAA